MSGGKLYLGCPVWAHAPWRGRFFTAAARREDFLPQYGRVFSTAEGNATFYGLPSPATVARWAAEAPPDFRFCLKFPRGITHEHQLVGPGAAAETQRFLERIAPLGARLGPSFLQLPPGFGPARRRDLAAFLRALPRDFACAVEVRHPGFFDAGAEERALDETLAEAGVDRVNFDTRGLHASGATDAVTMDAKHKKPRGPLRTTVTGRRPFVRFVGDPDLIRNDTILGEWSAVVGRWVDAGLSVYFFTHHPDDAEAPALARRFQSMVHAVCPAVPAPARWPVEDEEEQPPTAAGGQLSLF